MFPYLGELLTKVINHLLSGMILQVPNRLRKSTPKIMEVELEGPFIRKMFVKTVSLGVPFSIFQHDCWTKTSSRWRWSCFNNWSVVKVWWTRRTNGLQRHGKSSSLKTKNSPPSLKLTANAPENRPRAPKGKDFVSNGPMAFRGDLLVLGSVKLKRSMGLCRQ